LRKPGALLCTAAVVLLGDTGHQLEDIPLIALGKGEEPSVTKPLRYVTHAAPPGPPAPVSDCTVVSRTSIARPYFTLRVQALASLGRRDSRQEARKAPALLRPEFLL
jgi:hypothetical protein